MRAFRGPRTTRKLIETDSRSLDYFAKDWWPGKRITLDGTLEKQGERHTVLGIAFSEQDIRTLHAGLLDYYAKENKRLRAEKEKALRTVATLESVLEKIHKLTAWQRHRAPNNEDLIDAVAEIADHFSWAFTRQRAFRSRHKWLRWKSL